MISFLPLEIYLSYLSDRKKEASFNDKDFRSRYYTLSNLQSRMTDWSRWEFEIIEILLMKLSSLITLMLVHYYNNNNTTLGAPLTTSTVYLTFFMGANQDKASGN